jgi:hypothetical protein
MGVVVFAAVAELEAREIASSSVRGGSVLVGVVGSVAAAHRTNLGVARARTCIFTFWLSLRPNFSPAFVNPTSPTNHQHNGQVSVRSESHLSTVPV